MVYLIYYKYIIGWKKIEPDFFEELNNKPILGIYLDYKKALIKVIVWNIKNHYNDYEIYPEYYDSNGKMINFEKYELDELINIYNKITSELNKNIFEYKYTEKYCVLQEWNIES